MGSAEITHSLLTLSPLAVCGISRNNSQPSKLTDPWFSAELKQERDRQEQCQAKLDVVQAEMSMLKQELEGVRMAAAMSEQAKSDEVASIREHYEQEISSMQQLLGGKSGALVARAGLLALSSF